MNSEVLSFFIWWEFVIPTTGQHYWNYFGLSLASLSVTVRLKTHFPSAGLLSGSTQKYPRRSNWYRDRTSSPTKTRTSLQYKAQNNYWLYLTKGILCTLKSTSINQSVRDVDSWVGIHVLEPVLEFSRIWTLEESIIEPHFNLGRFLKGQKNRQVLNQIEFFFSESLWTTRQSKFWLLLLFQVQVELPNASDPWLFSVQDRILRVIQLFCRIHHVWHQRREWDMHISILPTSVFHLLFSMQDHKSPVVIVIK